MTETRKVNYTPFDVNDSINSLNFLIRSRILSSISTAIPVRVDRVYKSIDSSDERPKEGGGATYISATPLICQLDNEGNALPQTSIPKLRWFRLQHGNCAFICDPEVGDVGLAVFCQRDVSNLNGGTTPIPPATWRTFDMSDGIYIGGLWGKKPENFVKIESGDITITSTNTVTVNCKSATINATTSITGKTPTTHLTGDLNVDGTITAKGEINDKSGSGGSSMSGMRSIYNSHVHGSSPTPTPQM